MYSLLLPDDKKKVEAEYRSRRAHAILMLIGFLLLFTAISLLPALITAIGRRNAAVVVLNSVQNQAPNTERAELLEWAKTERQKLVALAPAASSTPYEYFQEILKAKPSTVTIASLTYNRTTKSLGARGKAADRQTLLQFQSSLVASGEFSKVDFPVDNLAKDKDIDFQFTLVLK